MDMCKVIVHDFVKGKDEWYGPYQSLEILTNTVWATDESGRKIELASKDADGFWYVADEGDRAQVRTKTIKVSMAHEIKAATSPTHTDLMVPPEGIAQYIEEQQEG